jgi:hypothetical protein
MTESHTLAHWQEASQRQGETIREQDAEIERLRLALRTIRDLPIPEQDNMIAANMRAIAREALKL